MQFTSGGIHLVGHAGDGTGLRNRRGSIEAGAHDTVEVLNDWCAISELESLWHHGPTKAHAREASILGQRTRLHGDLQGLTPSSTLLHI